MTALQEFRCEVSWAGAKAVQNTLLKLTTFVQNLY